MSEHLALKTDKASEWQRRKEATVLKDLSPRVADAGRKSAWAHCNTPQQICQETFTDPSRATCDVQALAMFIFDQRHSSANRRSQIVGVSVLREAIDPHVEDEPNPHPVAAYRATHRSLLVEDADTRQRVASRVLAEEAFTTWRYTRDQMADLLSELLKGGFIADEFRYDAQSLLAQWRHE